MKRSPAMRRLVLGILILVGMVSGQVQAKPLAILPQVHDGADVVLVVPSLRQFSDKLVLLGNAMGLGAQMPPDPLMMLKMMGGMMQGVDDNANLAVVVYDLRRSLQIERPLDEARVVILLPITSKDQFMGNFQGTAQDMGNGLTGLTLMGKPVICKALGDKYMMISKDKAALDLYKPAGVDLWSASQGAVADDYIQKGDAVLMFNPKTVSVLFNENLGKIRSSAKAAFDEDQQKKPEMAQFRPLLDYYFDLMLRGTKSLLENTTGMAMGLTINDAGIRSGLSMQFADGSELNNILAKSPEALGDFDRLPALPWISLMQFDAAHMDQKLMLALTKQCIPGDEIVPEQGKEAAAAFRKIVDNYKLYNYGYEQMQVSNAAGLTQILTAIECEGHSAQVFTQLREVMHPCVVLFNAIMNNVDDKNKNLMSMAFDEDALKIDSATKTDMMTISGKEEIGQAFAQTFGESSLKIYTSYNDAGVASVMGGQDMVKQTLDAMTASKADPAIKKMVDAMRPNLPANRFAESYLNLSHYLKQVQTQLLKQPNGMQMAMIMGMFQLPETLPPIVNTASNTAGGVRMDSFVPMDTLKAVTQKGMAMGQMFMSGQGGMSGPGGGQNGGGGAPPAPIN